MFSPSNQPVRFNRTPDLQLQQSEGEYNPAFRAAQVSAVVVGVVGAHRFALRRFAGYSPGLYNLAHTIEERSPARILRTFGVSQLFSSYLPAELRFTADQLYTGRKLTNLGEHFQRILGQNIDILSQKEGLQFVRRTPSSSYLDLLGHKDVQVRFAKEGRLTGSSYRFHKPLGEVPFRSDPLSRGNVFQEARKLFRDFRERQRPRGYTGGAGFATESAEELFFQPLYARRKGRYLRNIRETGGRVFFDLMERPQRLFSEIGLGLPRGSYNKSFHIPFVGEGGFLNKLLTKRVLPIVLGITALSYGDYLLDHKPSELLASIPLKANLLRAEVTDRLPGARAITDLYSETVPGSQYGPLALPLGGFFAGGLLHYSKVAAGLVPQQVEGPSLFKSLRNLAKGLPSGTTRRGSFARHGIIGTGLGLLAMLPFIPGMLGSRKTASELRRIYSGEEPIPIRSGRWWDLGTTPFEGNRIKYFRQHWYPRMKSRSERISLYGSEENYWDHHPIISPLAALRDPYYLERLHYKDRPYPVTSPAFASVPIIGPLLAATVGKLFKPPKLMHEGEFTVGQFISGNVSSVSIDSNRFRVIDGDTLSIGRNRYRLVGVDAPEAGTRPGLAAANQTERFLKAHQRVQVSFHGKDDYGRHLVDVRSGKESLSQNLLDMGLAQREIVGTSPGLLGAMSATVRQLTELVGLPGFIGRSIYEKIFPAQEPTVRLQGSGEIDSLSRRYYDLELGAIVGPALFNKSEPFGYSEPLRRFIQREREGPTINDIPNQMPDWLPGSSYFVNFRTGDPYVKISEGHLRLPGPGYTALHPEMRGLAPDEYPDFERFKILADVAPYSREFGAARRRAQKMVEGSTAGQIEFERVLDQVRQVKESSAKFSSRRFTGDTEELTGTVRRAGPSGVELEEFPGQRFIFSSLGMSAADLSAEVLRNQNNLTRSQIATEVESRQERMRAFLSEALQPGQSVSLTVPEGSGEHAKTVRAVISAGGININRALLDQGLARFREDRGGAEAGSLYGIAGQVLGALGETLSFTGDESVFNPLRYIPTPYHTKLWQNRTALSQYQNQEVYGTRIRRWDRPIHDFIAPYIRGAVRRFTGIILEAGDVQRRRDLDTLTDTLDYMRGLTQAAAHPGKPGKYTSQAKRTSIGADLSSSSRFLRITIPGRDKQYFAEFLHETDPDTRAEILASVSPEMARALSAQWAANDADIQRSRGEGAGLEFSGGRPVTDEGLAEYRRASTNLDYGDYQRSQEVAEFFNRTGFRLPGEESSIWDEVIDYDDVKLKIIQQEGYNKHDFNLFDDRASLLWRKPWIDGVVRELTQGDDRSVERLRQSVERIMLEAYGGNPSVRISAHPAREDRSNIRVNITDEAEHRVMREIRRDPDAFRP